MNHFRTTIFLSLLTALLLFIGQALGGNTGMGMALVMAAVMNFGSYWYSDKLVLSMYGAREVGADEAPAFYKTVEGLVQRAGLPMPKVYIMENDTPNAFATGRDPEHAAVAATTGLLRILTREELAGVMAHELAHVKNRDTLIGAVAATIAGAIAWIANMAQWALMFGMGRQSDEEEGGSGIAGIVMVILAPIAATLIQMAVSRSREYGADDGGAAICGNPLWLANALRKLESANQRIPMHEAEAHPTTAHLFIVNPLSGGGVAHWFSTHPPIEERVRRLEEAARTLSA
jgi:heat shock protein HtpX